MDENEQMTLTRMLKEDPTFEFLLLPTPLFPNGGVSRPNISSLEACV